MLNVDEKPHSLVKMKTMFVVGMSFRFNGGSKFSIFSKE